MWQLISLGDVHFPQKFSNSSTEPNCISANIFRKNKSVRFSTSLNCIKIMKTRKSALTDVQHHQSLINQNGIYPFKVRKHRPPRNDRQVATCRSHFCVGAQLYRFGGIELKKHSVRKWDKPDLNLKYVFHPANLPPHPADFGAQVNNSPKNQF